MHHTIVGDQLTHHMTVGDQSMHHTIVGDQLMHHMTVSDQSVHHVTTMLHDIFVFRARVVRKDISVFSGMTPKIKIPCVNKELSPGGIRTHNPSRRAAVDTRLKRRDHWDRLYCHLRH